MSVFDQAQLPSLEQKRTLSPVQLLTIIAVMLTAIAAYGLAGGDLVNQIFGGWMWLRP